MSQKPPTPKRHCDDKKHGAARDDEEGDGDRLSQTHGAQRRGELTCAAFCARSARPPGSAAVDRSAVVPAPTFEDRDMSNEIEMAEQQLTGYAHARAGHTIEALADGMGLTAGEWKEIQARGAVRLDDCDVDALSAHLSK